MGVPTMMILLQQKSSICIWMEKDNFAVFNIKVKNMNRFHTSSKTVTDFMQTEKKKLEINRTFSHTHIM